MSNNILNFLGDNDTLTSIVKKASQANHLVVIDFFATWCGPCRALGAQIPQIASDNPGVIFLKCNIDDNKELAAKYGVSAVPNIKFLRYKDNAISVLDEVSGADVQSIKAKIAQYK